ncbi:MAG: MraY family glycosyltransferase [Lysobacteraceae bacterium]
MSNSIERAIAEVLMSGAICLALQWLLLPLAKSFGLLDHPAGRKDHDEPTAVTGGIAIAAAIFVTMAVFTNLSPDIVAFMVAAGLLLLIGMLDDRFDLRWWLRVLAQCGAVLVMIYAGGLRVEHVGEIFGVQSTGLGELSVPFTMFATVGVINAINMSDGVDGLGGGVVLAALCMLGAASVHSGNMTLAELALIFAGAVAGFLALNMRFPWQPRARVFLGNAGSTFLGFTIAWMSFRLTQNRWHPVTPVLAPWLIATPVIDCVVLIARRLLAGQSPFRADREHMHHLMLDAGFTPMQVSLTLIAMNLIIGLAASVALLKKVPQPLLVLAFVGLCLGYFWLVARRERAVAAFVRLNRILTMLHLKRANELLSSTPAVDD